MRLLNVNTYCLEQYYEPYIPRYAILSHRWGEEEVLFADLEARTFKSKKAFEKVRFTCEQAVQDGLEFVWIDTLSIDKSSSAELSEAINSMFRWYQAAAVCYAFLRDVSIPVAPSEGKVHCVDSHWFERGWTLQELIAPTKLEFFGSGWKRIGSRHSLSKEISERTKVDIELLQDDRRPLEEILSTLTIAKRMSWAARRETSRLEDRAYSLMGLFGVNMPLLYGEGRKAFTRLQEEIMKTSMDLSILAWENPFSGPEPRGRLLATDPNDFQSCSTISPAPTINSEDFERTSFSIVNSGFRIEKPYIVPLDENEIALSLECRHEGDIVTVLALRLWYVTSQPEKAQQKKRHGDLCYVNNYAQHTRLVSVGFLAPKRPPDWPTLTLGRGFNAVAASGVRPVREHTHIWVETPPLTSFPTSWEVLDCWPRELWDLESLVFNLCRQSFLETPYQTIQKTKERQVHGALALQSRLGSVTILFSHRFVSQKRNTTIRSYIYTTLAPYHPESFPRGSQTRFTELEGELAHSLQLRPNHLLRVELGGHRRHGLHIGHLKLSLDIEGEIYPYRAVSR